MSRVILIFELLILVAANGVAQERLRVSGIPGVVAKGAAVELVKGGFTFTEGPVGTADGGLYFTDLGTTPTRIYRLDAKGVVALFRENTHGANGLALDRSGNLFAVEGDGKRIIRMDEQGNVFPVATQPSGGQEFLQPNDLIVDAKGGIYFTDPGPRPLVPGRKAYVYYLPPGAKQALVLDDQIMRPNGLILTNDGRRLIVDDTIGNTIFAFDVQPDGSVKNKRPFSRLRNIPAGLESGADGMALDRNGRVYVTSVAGIQVFDGTGQYRGTIQVPRKADNLAFSGPGKRTLYIAAGEGLYRLPMLSQGPNRPGK